MESDGFAKLDKKRCGILVGSGMGGLQVFQDGVKNLVEKGYKKISPFFIPYAITNMGGALLAIETGWVPFSSPFPFFFQPAHSLSLSCADFYRVSTQN